MEQIKRFLPLRHQQFRIPNTVNRIRDSEQTSGSVSKMKLKPFEAKFLSEQLKLPIQLKQRLERVASYDGELSIDDVDVLLQYCRQRLPELESDKNNAKTDIGRQLEKLINKLVYE